MFIIAILLGLLVFKLTLKMFSFSIRVVLFGLAISKIVPTIFAMLMF